MGDNNTVLTKTGNIILITQQVTAEAQTTMQAANVANQNRFLFNIIYPLIGSVVFLVALFLVWRILKVRYIKILSKAKPEVSNS